MRGTVVFPPVAVGRPTPVLALLVALGWVPFWFVAHVLDPAVVQLGWRIGLTAAVGVVCAAVAVLVCTLRRGRGDLLAADALVVATAVVLSGFSTLALHGTSWGMAGLSADASFRSEAVTRFAHSPTLDDYAYRGLPAYYPPALGWVQGRIANLLDVPAWGVLKPSEIVLAGTVPLIAFWLWRRVMAPLPAAAVVALSSLVSVDLLKPDEWLVLICAVPWWIDLVPDVRAPGVRRWAPWQHGLIGGVILLIHTYYLLPLAIASVVAIAFDLVRRRRPALSLRRATTVVGVGLLVSCPYWVPIVSARARGASADNLQMRYTFPGADVPPYPLPVDVPGVLGIVGVVWLAWTAQRWHRHPDSDRLAAALASVLAGGYLTMVAGGIAVRLGVGLLTFKTDELIVLGQVVAGVMGSHVFLRLHVRWTRSPRVQVAVIAFVAVVAGAAGVHFALWWVAGPPAQTAQTTRYPSGAFPAGAHDHPAVNPPAFVRPHDPSVAQVAHAWKRSSGSDLGVGTVLVTARVDLLAVRPVHPFNTWKSIYSNPLGRFDQRLTLLRRVARCPTSSCAARLLINNPYDRVDGLVLERQGSTLRLPVLVDDFPHRSRTTALVFPAKLFEGPQFIGVTTGRLAVIAVR